MVAGQFPADAKKNVDLSCRRIFGAGGPGASFATGFEGGPIFPLLFIGGTVGLAMSKILPFIPQGVGVSAGMAGVAAAGFPIPLTVALLLGVLGGQLDLLPVVTLGAVIGFLIGKALTPMLPKPKPTAPPG